MLYNFFFFFSSRRRHTRCALVTGVQTCALPIFTDRDQFVYMAAYGARLAALNALNGDSLAYDNSAMPWVVFTDPQVAGVGLTEAMARQRGFAVETSVISLDQVPRALAARDTRARKSTRLNSSH